MRVQLILLCSRDTWERAAPLTTRWRLSRWPTRLAHKKTMISSRNRSAMPPRNDKDTDQSSHAIDNALSAGLWGGSHEATGCIERLPKGLSMGETGSVALLRPIFVVTHYRAGTLRTENLRNLYGVEGGTLTKVVASDKQSEPMLDRWISTHAAHEHWITTGRHQGVWHVGYNHACCPT